MVPNLKEHRIPVIYLITNTVNGKIYVGSAKDFYHRYGQYRKLGRREDRLMARAIRKYGFDKFEFSILERVPCIEDLVAREQHHIDTLQPFHPKGYNISPTAGSSLGVKHTPESRTKLSKARMGKIGRPVVQIDMKTGEVVAEYQSANVASRVLGIAYTQIHGTCRGIKISAAGYQWCWKDQYDPVTYVVRHRKARGGPRGTHRPVIQKRLDGSEIRIWDNPVYAAKAIGLHPDSIRHACYGTLQTAGGYRWTFVSDLTIVTEINTRLRREWEVSHGLG